MCECHLLSRGLQKKLRRLVGFHAVEEMDEETGAVEREKVLKSPLLFKERLHERGNRLKLLIKAELGSVGKESSVPELGRSPEEGWSRQWHPTPVLLPGKSHGWRSLVGCSPCGCKESDRTETT